MGSTLLRALWSSSDPEISWCVSRSSWPPAKGLVIIPTTLPWLPCTSFCTGTDIFLWLSLGNGPALEILHLISSGSEFTSKLVGTDLGEWGATLESSRHVFPQENLPDLALVLPLLF
ncbi:hypothetical protein O181_095153 [Austropuccinia psidii MF-1]|uniref:Uncharacterized protein n=1 Tax=Austropuccinia psidii MF-1 TaxID=1389203 RepID=A0A9Q3PAX6_9BASI|nr:hypothetical protein [Austropuccinia psidii MF-1]